MLKLDPKDPLDRLLIRELNNIERESRGEAPETMGVDDWLRFNAEWGEEPDLEDLLRSRGLKAGDVLREAAAYRTAFRKRLDARRFPFDDRYSLCQILAEQADSAPSRELLELFCDVLCGDGWLLGSDEEFEDEQRIAGYLTFQDERRELFQALIRRGGLVGRFAEATKIKRSPQPVDCAVEAKYEVFQIVTNCLDLPENGAPGLLDNLEYYMRVAEASPALHTVEPLYLFLLLTRNRSRMCKAPAAQLRIAPPLAEEGEPDRRGQRTELQNLPPKSAPVFRPLRCVQTGSGRRFPTVLVRIGPAGFPGWFFS